MELTNTSIVNRTSEVSVNSDHVRSIKGANISNDELLHWELKEY